MFSQNTLSRSPAGDPSKRKTEEGTIQQRMKHMIDLQTAYNGSFEVGESRKLISQAPVTPSLDPSKEKDSINKVNGAVAAGADRNNDPQQSFRSIMPVYRPSESTSSSTRILEQSPSTSVGSADSMIGKGKLIFPKTYETSVSASQSQYQAIDHRSPHENSVPITEDTEPYIDYVDTPEPKHHSSFCCLLGPCLKCIQHWWNAENLHRSFCYAAIDGMLTGAGLAGTLTGFGWSASVFLVAICAVACTADALCMALGHVWSTHVLSHQAATEHRRERSAFEANRFESKTRLVDLLLSRGMLKIDAASIADTLEGYPDIFVEALVGEDICSSKTPNGSQYDLVRSNSNPDTFRYLLNQPASYHSYGQFNELKHDPDLASVVNAVNESKKEGFVMFISFSLFGSIPSILMYLISTSLGTAERAEGEATDDEQTAAWVSALSASLTVICIIIWCLGVWKSHFFEPESWILFGVECVVVLLVCVLSAYWLGVGLSNVLSVPGVHGFDTATNL